MSNDGNRHFLRGLAWWCRTYLLQVKRDLPEFNPEKLRGTKDFIRRGGAGRPAKLFAKPPAGAAHRTLTPWLGQGEPSVLAEFLRCLGAAWTNRTRDLQIHVKMSSKCKD